MSNDNIRKSDRGFFRRKVKYCGRAISTLGVLLLAISGLGERFEAQNQETADDAGASITPSNSNKQPYETPAYRTLDGAFIGEAFACGSC